MPCAGTSTPHHTTQHQLRVSTVPVDRIIRKSAHTRGLEKTSPTIDAMITRRCRAVPRQQALAFRHTAPLEFQHLNAGAIYEFACTFCLAVFSDFAAENRPARALGKTNGFRSRPPPPRPFEFERSVPEMKRKSSRHRPGQSELLRRLH